MHADSRDSRTRDATMKFTNTLKLMATNMLTFKLETIDRFLLILS